MVCEVIRDPVVLAQLEAWWAELVTLDRVDEDTVRQSELALYIYRILKVDNPTPSDCDHVVQHPNANLRP